jgi:hypothetical protein
MSEIPTDRRKKDGDTESVAASMNGSQAVSAKKQIENVSDKVSLANKAKTLSHIDT